MLGLWLLMSEVLADNIAFPRMLQKAGFPVAGRVPCRYRRHSAYRDTVILFVEWPA